jgi:hypothetical protein
MYAMSDILHIPARPHAQIACDMTSARDTPKQRRDEYVRLFADALIDRERREGTIAFAFRADPQVRAAVEDLAHREAVCCPFLDYRVETIGQTLVWSITNPVSGEQHATAEAVLDIFYELTNHAGASTEGILEQLAASDVKLLTTQGASLG